MHKISFFAIDNFYDDPDYVRDIALSSEYNEVGVDKLMNVYSGGAWPGVTSIDVFRYPKVDALVSKILGAPVRQIYNSGKFRLSYENDVSKSPLHIDDLSPNIFAGVVYLNKITDAIPGTIMYTHKQTKQTIADKSSYERIIKEGDITNLNKWDIDMVSYVKYNRLIVYPTNRYHGPGPAFGKTKEEARLVQLFLWEIL